MSLMRRKTDTTLLNDTNQTNRRQLFNWMVILVFIFQLVLPVALNVNAVAESNEAEEPATVQVQNVEEDTDEVDIEAEEKAAAEKAAAEKAAAEKAAAEKAAAEKAAAEKKVKEAANKEESEQPVEQPEKIEEPEEVVEEELEENVEDTEEEIEEEIDINAEGYDGVDPNALIPGSPLIFFAKGSIELAQSMNKRSLSRMTTGDLEPGEVRTSKKATKVDGFVNTWDIEVLIEGRDDIQTETTAVVLVIDRSGSMSGQKLRDAKNAANNFIDTMIPRDPNLSIAIVDFGPNVRVTSNFSRDTADLKAAVNGLTASGGTHTQAGILQGRNLLNAIADPVDNKYMVLLSDGFPTYSYEPTNWDLNNPIIRNGRNYFPGIYDGNFDDQERVGDGNEIDDFYTAGSGANPRRRYINNGEAAIRAGTDTKPDITSLYTIAVSAGTEGTDVLNAIASPGNAYSTDNSGQLTQIYDEIAGQISTQFALNNANIIDELGDGFTLVDGSIVTTEGSTTVASADGTNNQTINWTIDPAVQELKAGSEDVRQAKMTYRVEINPDIVNAPVATPGATTDRNLFKTNKSTVLTYTDSNNQDQEESIVSPEVDPVLLKIKKILKDAAGNIITEDPRLFNVQITNGGSGFNETPALAVGADYQILTTLRKEGTYNVAEISISGDSGTNLDLFEISYNVDGTSGTSFEVNHEGEIPRGDVVIEVTNKIIVQEIDFSFTKVDESGNPLEGSEFTLETIVSGDTVVIENTGVDPEFIFAGLTEGSYTLTETKAPSGYKLPINTWTIEVVRNDETGLLEIIIPDDSFLTADPEEGNKVENEPQSEFPQTGGVGGLSYVVAGLAILTTSLGIYIKKEKN